MATAANTSRKLIGSPRKMIPPTAAMTGTLNCTVAALVAFTHGNTMYQMA